MSPTGLRPEQAAHAVPVYAECPSCHFVTAPLWQLREVGRADGWPATVGCGYCAHEHVVDRDRAYAPETVVRHDACGAAVSCPPAADLVRCAEREGGCGDIFAGPAAVPPAG